MKTSHHITLTFTFTLIFLYQIGTCQVMPPGISWKRSDRINFYPQQITSPPNLDITSISEDWWYDHKNSYEGGIVDPANFNGFITCGYSSIKNIAYQEDNDGCYLPDYPLVTAPGKYCDEEFDFT